VVVLAALDRLTCTFLLAAILFVLLMGFASFRKGLLWALRGDMGDYYIVDQRRNWIVTKHVDPEELGRELGGAEGVGGSAMIELSKQEQQLVEILREWTGNDEYRLDIERTGGAWEIKLSMLYKKKKKWARGVGTTFNEAWDSMVPSWAKGR
jgi:hypothetical protein